MEAHHEVERLAAVYAEYARTRAGERRWSPDNAGNRAMLAERGAALRVALGAHGFLPLGERPVLEVGCGTGEVLAGLLALGATPGALRGIDLLPETIAVAQHRHPGIRFEVGNAEQIRQGDRDVEMVLAFTVFTSILDDGMAGRVAAEIDRVLRPGGAVVWYDFRVDNPRNRHVRGLGRRAIATLFPGYGVHMRSITVLPPLARRLGRATSWAYPLLARLPALRTHYLGLLRKPA
jgi:ubiquinone/menaquinone biosynthesis C-methylase UbiE